ncbi:Dabb family protein [Verrucomicrobiota bacterium]
MKKLLIIFLIMLAGCSMLRESDRGKVHHVVLCWLKDSGNVTQRSRIIEVSRSFKEIPGVLDVRAGEVLESDRKIVDDGFDVAITLSFSDTQSLNEYLAHPIHQKAKNEVLLPIIKKIVVYDFIE